MTDAWRSYVAAQPRRWPWWTRHEAAYAVAFFLVACTGQRAA